MNILIESPKTAVLQIAADSPDRCKQLVSCEFRGNEGKRLSLSSLERVAILTPVTLEYNDALFLGEVVSCRPNAEGKFELEIVIEQILTGLESLINLRQRLLGQGYPHTSVEIGAPFQVARRM